MEDEIRIRVLVRGRVQGVGYRYFAVTAARRLGLAGWVRNRRDGTVEVQAQGGRPAVRAFVASLQEGPQWSAVDAVQTTDLPVRRGASSFEVRPDA